MTQNIVCQYIESDFAIFLLHIKENLILKNESGNKLFIVI